MAEYKVQAPDGKMLSITGPDDATDEQLQEQAAKLYSQYQQSQKTEEAKPAAKEGPVSPESPALTFASKAVNAMGFGLPEYLDKKFGSPGRVGKELWQSPEQRQQVYAEAAAANPNAARYGEIGGDLGGVLIPAGLGAKAGYKGVNAVLGGLERSGKIAPRTIIQNGREIQNTAAGGLVDLGSGLARRAAQGTGMAMGGQFGAGLPDAAQGVVNMFAPDANLPGSIPKGVAKSAEANQYLEKLPGVGSFYSATLGQVAPIGLSALEMLKYFKQDKKE